MNITKKLVGLTAVATIALMTLAAPASARITKEQYDTGTGAYSDQMNSVPKAIYDGGSIGSTVPYEGEVKADPNDDDNFVGPSRDPDERERRTRN
jgi:hypothetical protein